jgi:hypothetical protein
VTSVSAGSSRITRPQTCITAHATASAHPKWSEGIAANSFANPRYALCVPYDEGPNRSGVDEPEVREHAGR